MIITSQDRLFTKISTHVEQNMLSTDYKLIKALLAVQQTAAWHQQTYILETSRSLTIYQSVTFYGGLNNRILQGPLSAYNRKITVTELYSVDAGNSREHDTMTLTGSAFQILAVATEKARLLIVDS